MNENKIRKLKIENKSLNLMAYSHDDLVNVLHKNGPIPNMWITNNAMFVTSWKTVTQYSLADIVWIGYTTTTYKYQITAMITIIDCNGIKHEVNSMELYLADALLKYFESALPSALVGNELEPLSPTVIDRKDYKVNLDLYGDNSLGALVKQYSTILRKNSMIFGLFFLIYIAAMGIVYLIYAYAVPYIQLSILEDAYTINNYFGAQVYPYYAQLIMAIVPLFSVIIGYLALFKHAGYFKHLLNIIAVLFFGLSLMLGSMIIFTDDTINKINEMLKLEKTEFEIEEAVVYLQGFGNGDGLHIETLGDFDFDYDTIDELYVSSAYLASSTEDSYENYYYLGEFEYSLFNNVVPMSFRTQEEVPTEFLVKYVDTGFDNYNSFFIIDIERLN